MRIKTLTVISILIFSLLLVGCGDTDPLLGTWEEPSSGIMFNFMEDGRVVISRGGLSYSTDYEKQEPDILLFKGSTDGQTPEQRMTYKVEDDHLILSIEGIDTILNRKK